MPEKRPIIVRRRGQAAILAIAAILFVPLLMAERAAQGPAAKPPDGCGMQTELRHDVVELPPA